MMMKIISIKNENVGNGLKPFQMENENVGNGLKPFQMENENEVQILKTKQIRNESLLYEGVAYSKKEYVANILIENDILFASMGVGSLGRTSIFYKSETNKPTSVDSTIKILRDSKKDFARSTSNFFQFYCWSGNYL
jgi:hypothetical protein